METSRAVLQSGGQAVTLLLELLASMVMWSGLMEMLSASGDVARLGRLLRRLLRPMFPDLEDDDAWAAVGMNIAANMLGLGNAATPAGVRAAQLLCTHGETGLRALAMLLALNNSSLQLIPTTVMTLRSAAGATNPTDIWLPTLISSGASTLTAAVLMTILCRRKKA